MKKILVIDDEEGFCSSIKEILEITGNYKVITAYDGKSGIKTAISHKPDLILLDIIMPVVDGFEVLKMLKNDPRTRDIPVVMLTARDDDDSKVKAASLYNEGYLIKPVEIAVLRSTVEKILSR